MANKTPPSNNTQSWDNNPNRANDVNNPNNANPNRTNPDDPNRPNTSNANEPNPNDPARNVRNQQVNVDPNQLNRANNDRLNNPAGAHADTNRDDHNRRNDGQLNTNVNRGNPNSRNDPAGIGGDTNQQNDPNRVGISNTVNQSNPNNRADPNNPNRVNDVNNPNRSADPSGAYADHNRENDPNRVNNLDNRNRPNTNVGPSVSNEVEQNRNNWGKPNDNWGKPNNNTKTGAADKTRLSELDKSLADNPLTDVNRASWNRERGEILTRMNAPDAKTLEVKKADVLVIDNALPIDDKASFYPFGDMKPGQGFFVANEPNQSTLQNARKINTHVAAINDLYTVVETNHNGDEVWEDVYVKTRKWENDKVLIDASGSPILGHDPVARPNVVYSRRYVVRHIAAETDLIGGKKAEKDGVLVVRVI